MLNDAVENNINFKLLRKTLLNVPNKASALKWHNSVTENYGTTKTHINVQLMEF